MAIMRFLAAAVTALSTVAAHAQGVTPVLPYTAGAPVTNSNPLPTTGTLSGFPTVQTTGTPISVTTGGVTGNLPSGAVVVATNTGTTNAAYCKLGASATTSDQYIAPSGGWFSFTVGANTQLTCITSTSTTTVNMVGGSGLPTGTGGGSGGGGGSVSNTTAALSGMTTNNAATQVALVGTTSTAVLLSGTWSATLVPEVSADGGTTWAQTQFYNVSTQLYTNNVSANGTYDIVGTGGKTHARVRISSYTSGTVTGQLTAVAQAPSANSVDAYLSTIATNTGGAIPTQAVTVTIGGVGVVDTNSHSLLLDPCQYGAKVSVPISQTASTKLVSAVSGKKNYVCAISTIGADAENMSLVEGTGTNCGTVVDAIIGGTTAANGMNFPAGGGMTFGSGVGQIAAGTTANTDVCLLQSGSGRVAGSITVAQQ